MSYCNDFIPSLLSPPHLLMVHRMSLMILHTRRWLAHNRRHDTQFQNTKIVKEKKTHAHTSVYPMFNLWALCRWDSLHLFTYWDLVLRLAININLALTLNVNIKMLAHSGYSYNAPPSSALWATSWLLVMLCLYSLEHIRSFSPCKCSASLWVLHAYICIRQRAVQYFQYVQCLWLLKTPVQQWSLSCHMQNNIVAQTVKLYKVHLWFNLMLAVTWCAISGMSLTLSATSHPSPGSHSPLPMALPAVSP